MSTLAVGAITDASGGATATINAYTPTASNMAGRNRVINGNMAIDQRNAGAAVTVGTGSNFVVDRFTSTNATATGTITGQQATLGNSKSIKLTATAAVTDLTTNKYVYGVKHRPEAQNVFDLNGKSVTFSFKVETNWAGNLPVAVINSALNRSYVVDTAIVSGTNTVSITLPMEAATVAANDNSVGLEVTIGFNNEATYRTATTGSWIAGLFWVSTSSTQWTKTLNNFINVTEVQLEEGSAATPFEHRSYGTELALCQRYYENSNGAGGVAASGDSYVVHGTSGSVYTTIIYKVGKRASPTVAALIFGGGTGAAVGGGNQSAFYIGTNQSTPSTFGWAASAEL